MYYPPQQSEFQILKLTNGISDIILIHIKIFLGSVLKKVIRYYYLKIKCYYHLQHKLQAYKMNNDLKKKIEIKFNNHSV